MSSMRTGCADVRDISTGVFAEFDVGFTVYACRMSPLDLSARKGTSSGQQIRPKTPSTVNVHDQSWQVPPDEAHQDVIEM